MSVLKSPLVRLQLRYAVHLLVLNGVLAAMWVLRNHGASPLFDPVVLVLYLVALFFNFRWYHLVRKRLVG